MPAQDIRIPLHKLKLGIINARFKVAPFCGSVNTRSLVFRGGRISFQDVGIGILSPGGRVLPRAKRELSPQGIPLE